MRPVRKSNSGEEVAWEDSCGTEVRHTIQVRYVPYGEAKFPLAASIGRYCSYCEEPRDIADLDVEHCVPKSRGGDEAEWENFLIACSVCNSRKGTTIPPTDCHWSHLNNTFLDFVYDNTGRVKVNSSLPPLSQQRAQNLLETLKLDAFPERTPRPSKCDFRWKRRYEAWKKAEREKLRFVDGGQGKAGVDDVIDLAKVCGCWSIWFTVFEGFDDVRARLISDFPGTRAECFAPGNHYKPVPLHPENTDDPV